MRAVLLPNTEVTPHHLNFRVGKQVHKSDCIIDAGIAIDQDWGGSRHGDPFAKALCPNGLPKTGESLIKLPLGPRCIRSDDSQITSPSRLSRPIGRDTRLLDNNEKVPRGKH